MEMHTQNLVRKWVTTAACWAVGLLVFFPIFWMFLTSFKTELAAISMPPQLFFNPTLENYQLIFERSNYARFAWNSVVISVGSSLLGLLIAVPAAYAMAFYPSPRTKGTLLWMLSTKMLPPVGVLIPIYMISRELGLLDTRIALTVIFTMMNLPIIIWMVYTYFREIPVEILEAGRMDGAGTREEIRHIVVPVSTGGIAAAFLLSLILSWNEAFWSLNLTSSSAAPPDGLYCLIFQPGGSVLGSSVRRISSGHSPHPDLWLANHEATGARIDLWGGEIRSRMLCRDCRS